MRCNIMLLCFKPVEHSAWALKPIIPHSRMSGNHCNALIVNCLCGIVVRTPGRKLGDAGSSPVGGTTIFTWLSTLPIYIYIYIYIYILHTYIHTCMHIYIHTYTYIPVLESITNLQLQLNYNYFIFQNLKLQLNYNYLKIFSIKLQLQLLKFAITLNYSENFQIKWSIVTFVYPIRCGK